MCPLWVCMLCSIGATQVHAIQHYPLLLALLVAHFSSSTSIGGMLIVYPLLCLLTPPPFIARLCCVCFVFGCVVVAGVCACTAICTNKSTRVTLFRHAQTTTTLGQRFTSPSSNLFLFSHGKSRSVRHVASTADVASPRVSWPNAVEQLGHTKPCARWCIPRITGRR